MNLTEILSKTITVEGVEVTVVYEFTPAYETHDSFDPAEVDIISVDVDPLKFVELLESFNTTECLLDNIKSEL